MRSSRYTFRLSNYRCFAASHPAEFTIGDGITAFVGKNNSGKSAILKFFHDLRVLFSVPLHGLIERARWEGLAGIPSTVADPFELLTHGARGDMRVQITTPVYTASDGARSELIDLCIERDSLRAGVERVGGRDIKGLLGDINRSMCMVDSDGRVVVNMEALNRAMKHLQRSCYVPAYRYAGEAGGRSHYDMLVGSAFVDQWTHSRDGKDSKLRTLTASVEKHIRDLMKLKHFSTRRVASYQSLLVQIDERDLPIEQVGAGITQILMLLGTVALKQPSFLFIDEPELNLHPSLQLDLLTALGEYVQGNVVFATHNIGLARAAADRIYVVEQDRTSGHSRVSELDDETTLAQVLGELQYGSYSQLGGRRVLMVEGSTDVLVFQQFLKKLNVGHNVIVLPLGGKTMIKSDSAVQLAEVRRICSDVAAVIDSEKESELACDEVPRLNFQANCRSLSIECHITQRRATDNYLTQRALQAANDDSVRALQPFEKPPSKSFKSKAWLAAREMTKDELLDTDVGQFLKRWLDAPTK
jgi:ABC-type multidrug transport system ATPase subunit